MSKPVFDDLFTLSGRRNRKSYILYQLASIAAMTISALVAAGGFATTAHDGTLATLVGGALIIAGAVGIFASVASAWITAGQRARDIGWPGWTVISILIPYVGWIAALVFMIATGDTEVDNKYGPSQIKPQLST